MWRSARAGSVLLALVAALVLGTGSPAMAAPELSLSPASGAVGDSVTVSGTGFAAAPVEIRWGGESGPLLATTSGPDFSVDATIPEAEPSSYLVVAVVREGGAGSASAPFQVTGDGVARIPGGEVGSDPVQSGDRGGGVGGGLPDTTGGGDEAPPAGTGSTTVPGPGAPNADVAAAVAAANAAIAPAVAAANAAVAAADAANADTPTTTAPDGASGAAPAEGAERGAGAPDAASTGRSSEAARWPGLLLIGLGLALGAWAVTTLLKGHRTGAR